MADDAQLVALIRESLLARSEQRQAAARLMLRRLKTETWIDLSEPAIDVLRADEGPAVAEEVERLAFRLGLAERSGTDDEDDSPPTSRSG